MNNKNVSYINECIESMLPFICNETHTEIHGILESCDTGIIDDDPKGTGFDNDFRIILELFGCNCQEQHNRLITKNDILRQLVIIDSLYSTNIKRMRLFALEEICDEIWALCDDGNGVHTLNTLTSKTSVAPSLNNSIKKLFQNSYGYIRGNDAGTAPSLISKYLFFASVACPNDKSGFPIYDQIAYRVMRMVQKFIGIPATPTMQGSFDVEKYIAGLNSIITALTNNNPAFWENLPVLKFQLLDYFLWNIGKAGVESYSLLLSKNEVKKCYSNGILTKLPRRIAYWKKVYEQIKL